MFRCYRVGSESRAFFCTKWFLILDNEIANPPPKTKLFCLLSFGCPFFLFCITAFYSAICIQWCFIGKWLAYHTYNCLLNCFLEVSPSLTWGTAIHNNNFRKSIYHTLHMKDNCNSLQVFLYNVLLHLKINFDFDDPGTLQGNYERDPGGSDLWVWAEIFFAWVIFTSTMNQQRPGYQALLSLLW